MRHIKSTSYCILITLSLHCSNSDQHREVENKSYEAPVKSVMLYDTIHTWPLDTIEAALNRINKVISTIDKEAGYSLWKIQEDTLPDYRLLIEGTWPSQEVFDSIHVNPAFRKALDDDIHVFTETRKWELYRKFDKVSE